MSWLNLLKNTVYFKSPTGYDGSIVYGDAANCNATWEEVSKTVNSSGGGQIQVDTEIISEDEIIENSIVWLTSDTTTSKARTAKITKKYFDKLTGDVMYMSWL